MMVRTLIFFPLILMFISLQGIMAQNSDFIMDERDGNVYLVAKFNDQWWMCQNLKYDAKEGSGCYEDDETNCMLKGRLYNWATAMQACPEGYHLPGDDEWKALESYIGMDKDDLDKTFNRNSGTVGKFLRLDGGLSFDADYTGMINPKGNSSFGGARSYLWTSTASDNAMSWVRIIEKTKDGVERQMLDKNHKLAVRCVKAAEPEEPKVEESKPERPRRERPE